MIEEFPMDDISSSIDEVIESIFKSGDESASRKKGEEAEQPWELLPKDKVTAKVKCFLRDEGIPVEVNVEFKVEEIEGERIILSSPNFVFVWRCLKKGNEILLLSRDEKHLLRAEVESIDLRKELVTVVLKGRPIKYARQLFRVEVNPKEPIYIVMKVDNKPIVAKVNDINEEACSFIYKRLPLLPGDIFGVVLRFPDGKKIMIPNSEVITIRDFDRERGLKIYVLRISVPESERSYLRKYLITRQREILNKLKEG